MEIKCRRAVAYAGLVATLLAGCASAPPPAAEPQAAAIQSPGPAAQSAAQARQSSSDPERAFAEGYRAYTSRDFPRAADRLSYAAANSVTLADYALYYLGSVQRDEGDLAAAAATFDRLASAYPQSVMTRQGELELARAQLKLGRNADASATASRLAASAADREIEAQARLVEGQALLASGDSRAAYARLMELRDKFPRADTDAEARELAYSILASNPGIAEAASLAYRKGEAGLLLREGEPSLALAEAEKGLSLSPSASDRAELLWIEAQAQRANPPGETRALLAYLSLAPRGPAAPEVLQALALLYWRENDTARARAAFARIVTGFPSSHLAPDAMLRIGRIFEEEGKYDSARAEYRRLSTRYPQTEAGEEARFRAPWTYYMTRQYPRAATAFTAARAASPAQRDTFDYWHGRSLEKSGQREAARAIYSRVAASIDSNYYPALAGARVSAPPPDLPAAHAAEPSAGSTPAVSDPARFHLSRALALRSLGLEELEPDELRALEDHIAANAPLRDFVLAGFESAGAWYDGIAAATRMAKRGQLDPAVAERLRYPLAYWDLLKQAATARSLDPYLVLALARQESLFNPKARSVSDALGLMQLLPSTAQRVAAEHGVGGPQLDLFNPELNLKLGTAYLGDSFEMFGGDEFKSVAAYNGGEHAVQDWARKFPGDDDEWVENIGYRETREYVKKVIGARREYLLLYRPGSTASSSPVTRPLPGSTLAKTSWTSR